MPSNVLSVKDVNAAMSAGATQDGTAKSNVKSMEYHRQVLQSKMAEEGAQERPNPEHGFPCARG